VAAVSASKKSSAKSSSKDKGLDDDQY
jgi:hypothetical protein